MYYLALFNYTKLSLNFLAHLHLSCSNEYLLVGNYLSDLLSLKESNNLPQEYKNGIKLHRLIDTYTDNNSDVRFVNSLLIPYVGKYAPVATDVIFDYYLAQNWKKYNHQTITEFCLHSYSIIQSHIHIAPKKVQDITSAMILDNFLEKYTSKQGLDFVFEKLNKRSRFKVDFKNVLTAIEKESESINKSFLSFYPSIIKEVNIFCSC
jgi:acyl carrier protein phosphodiesterase